MRLRSVGGSNGRGRCRPRRVLAAVEPVVLSAGIALLLGRRGYRWSWLVSRWEKKKRLAAPCY
jgi:hypothetical protein